MEKAPGSLSQRAFSGVAWSAGARVGQQVITFFCTSILARHVSPKAYGVIGMATVIFNFAHIFRELGTAAALIRTKTVDRVLFATVFWANAGIGLAIALGLFFAAPLIAEFYREPMVDPVVRVLAVSFVISGLAIVHLALLTRELAFQRIAQAEFLSTVVAAVAAVVFALSGYGIWSLVAFSLVLNVVTTGLLWYWAHWMPSALPQWRRLKEIWEFSLNLSGFNIVNYFARNLDNIVVGRYLGATNLGYYQFAYNLMLYPVQGIAGVASRVLYPALAQFQDDNERFRGAYLRACQMLSAITFPVMMGILVTADPLVRTWLGPKWVEAVPLVQILAPVGLLQSMFTTVGQIYQTKGRTGMLFAWGVVSTALTLIAFVVGLSWGVAGVAVAYLAITVLLQYPGLAIAFRLIELPMGSFVRVVWPNLAASLAMAAIAAGALAVLRWQGVHTPVLQLLIVSAMGTAAYLAIGFWWRLPALLDLAGMLRGLYERKFKKS